MNYEFKLPDIGEGLVEGEIVKWFVKEGEQVVENQPLAAVLTDKAEVEIPSPKTGKVVKLFGRPGEKIQVHAPLAILEVAGNGLSAPLNLLQSKFGSQPPNTPSPSTVTRYRTDILATPMLRKLAKDMGVDIALVAGTGPQGRVLEADLKNFKGANATERYREEVPLPHAVGQRPTAAVKALASSLGVDLARVKGAGPGGRIVEGDVRAAAPISKPATTAASIARRPDDTIVPFTGIRRKIAERMVQSKRAVAHVTHMDECDMTAVLALRESLKPEAAKHGVKLTFLPFVIRALVKSLSEFPMFNSSLDEAAGEIVVKRRVNVGIAVAAPQGLVVPNIKGAQDKDVWALAAEIAALADKVRAHKIEAAELHDGTFTITNIGPIGGLFSTPIVNHPEVAILGLMKLTKRPAVRDGKVVAADMMNLVVSFDHRVVDGADAASFMNTLIKHLENPRTLI